MDIKIIPNKMNEITLNIIPETYVLQQALERLDKVTTKVLFITVDEKLKAALTDGDVRRAILSGASLDTTVKDIANYTPIYIVGDNKNRVKELFLKSGLLAIPIVDKDGKIENIYINNFETPKEERNKIGIPVVIMAGGLGTRLYPYTKILPKPLIPIEGIPISERIMQSFESIGCEKFYMITNYKKNMIKAYYADLDKKYNINFCEETKPLGTGGGLYLVKNEIDDTFILTNCDILILDDVVEMINYHKEKKNQITMVCSLKNFEIPYGIVSYTEGGEISSFEEKPKLSFFTNTGYYILEPTIFQYIGENENISMPDIIMRMKEDAQKVGIYPISEHAWLDMGQMDTMEGMERRIKELNII